ncbi:MAG: Gfo/Idh/MocA family oxidoreductase [Bacteroidales bacterium]|nr:Gfo/Idh/MocA family oxidoreductase [Bacteroidales bacterium]
MSKKNIMVIGAGQLGSRHLQGLAKSEEPFTIAVVDPNTSNLEVAINRFKEIAGYERHDLFSYKSLQEIPNLILDVVIIATNADVRAMITKQMVELFEVRNIIFEKVAFQSENQFLEIIELLQTKKIKSWVNCPRRHFPFYQYLKEYLSDKGPISMEVNGVDWGLACNAVHQIDLLAFLSGETRFQVVENLLHEKIYQSKRQNFIEFYGSFSGKSISGNHFKLSCEVKKDDGDKPFLTHQISIQGETILIKESQGVSEFYKEDAKIPYRTEEVKMMYQSGLTNLQVKQILDTGLSHLPTLEESFEIHKPLLSVLNEQYFKILGKRINELPIT